MEVYKNERRQRREAVEEWGEREEKVRFEGFGLGLGRSSKFEVDVERIRSFVLEEISTLTKQIFFRSSSSFFFSDHPLPHPPLPLPLPLLPPLQPRRPPSRRPPSSSVLPPSRAGPSRSSTGTTRQPRCVPTTEATEARVELRERRREGCD